MPENKIALVILAGGKSSRMGREKSDLILNGNTFLEIQIEKGKQLGIKKIYISGYKGVRCTEEIVMDRIKNRGPLGGLEACFRKASEEGFSHCLVLGVDTPLVPKEELKSLVDKAQKESENRAVLLRHAEKEESLMSVYESSLYQEIAQFLETGQASVFRFLNQVGYDCYDTQAEEYAYAYKLGATINLDDITHIDFLEDTIGTIPKRISCRYNPGGTFELGNGIMDNPGDAKYGMTTEQIFDAFRILKEKGAEEFGIHAFLASNTVTNEYYPELAKRLFELAVKLKEETGANIKFINLSGGVGIPYTPDQKPNDIRVIGEGVRKVYEEVLVPAGMGDVEIYSEMGRFMMGPYGCLVTKAIHEKHTHKEYIGVDACAVNLMRPAMYGAYHHITVMGKEKEPCDHKYDVTGSLCENNDKFAVDRMLPKIDMGDLLVIHDTGAHGFAMGYNYNGKLKSAEVLLKEDGTTEMIRRAETPEDYFATIKGFNF